MKQVIFILVCFCCAAVAQAQVADATTAVAHSELLLAAPAESSFQLPPANFEQLMKLERKGCLPVQQNPTIHGLTCGWADGWGGTIECPPSAVQCGVFSNGSVAYIACMTGENRVVGGLHLMRPL